MRRVIDWGYGYRPSELRPGPSFAAVRARPNPTCRRRCISAPCAGRLSGSDSTALAAPTWSPITSSRPESRRVGSAATLL